MLHDRIFVQVINLAATLNRASANAEALPILQVGGCKKGFAHVHASFVSLMLFIRMGSVQAERHGKESRPQSFLTHAVIVILAARAFLRLIDGRTPTWPAPAHLLVFE